MATTVPAATVTATMATAPAMATTVPCRHVTAAMATAPAMATAATVTATMATATSERSRRQGSGNDCQRRGCRGHDDFFSYGSHEHILQGSSHMLIESASNLYVWAW